MKVKLQFRILPEELHLPADEYIFKYIIGFGSGLLNGRIISKTDDPLVYNVEYEFIK
jgi:hypothetical protein